MIIQTLGIIIDPTLGIRGPPHLSHQASLVVQTVKRLPAMRETWVRSLGREDPLEKEVAIHSSTLAWKIPWTEEPDRLQSMGSQRVGHDWATSLSTFPHLMTYSSELLAPLKITPRRFPGGSVKNLPANTGDTGSILGLGKTPHAAEQLSLCSRAWGPTTELTCYKYWSPCPLEPMLHNKRRHHNEKPVHHNQRVASALWNQKKLTCSNKDPAQPIQINKVIKKQTKK